MKRRFVMMTHGKMAEGIAHTLTLFLGEDHAFETVCCYVDDTAASHLVSTWFESVKEEEELVILTDILGGSVNQLVLPYLSKDHTFLIAGFNFPLLLQLACLPQEPLTLEQLREVVNQAQPQLTLVNDFKSESVSRSDDE